MIPPSRGLLDRLLAQAQQQQHGAAYNPGAFTQFTPSPAPDFGPYAPPVQRIQPQQIPTGFQPSPLGMPRQSAGISPFHVMVSNILGQTRQAPSPIYTPLPRVGPFAQMQPVQQQMVPFAGPNMPRMIEAAKLGANQ